MTELKSRYGLTAARKHGQHGRDIRPASPMIDAHAHAWVDAAADYVKPHLDPKSLMLARFATPETVELNNRQNADRHSRMIDPRLRLGDMDEMGVDIQVVLPSPSQAYYTLKPDIATKAAQLINDGIAEQIAHKPARLVPFGTLPMQDSAATVAELERIVTKLGFKGVQILCNINGQELSDEAFAPFWKKAEQLGAAVLLHPGGFTHADRLTRFYFNNVIGQPLETTIALHYLIFDGVMHRHPKLKVIAVHGGGYAGAYSGRMDHAWGARPDSHARLPDPPTTYLKRIYFDTVVFTPDQLDGLIRTFGVDRLLMGTDYPFDMAEYDPIGHLASLGSLSEADLAKIAGGNVKKLLGI